MSTPVLGTSAAVAVILGEPGCDQLAARLEDALARLMPAAIRVELGIVIEARLWPAGQDAVGRFLRDAKIDIVPVDADLAAGEAGVTSADVRHPAQPPRTEAITARRRRRHYRSRELAPIARFPSGTSSKSGGSPASAR